MRINDFINDLKSKINANKQMTDQVKPEIVQINFRRLYYSVWIALAVNIAHILLFYRNLATSNEVEYRWRIGVILAHSIMAIVMCIGALFLARFKHRMISIRLMKLIFLTFVTTILLAGISLAAIDQLVTSSISPLFTSVSIIALVFLIPPKRSIVIYISSYILFFLTQSIYQADPAVLLSNRVNGISMVAIGIVMSNILWKYHLVNLQFQRKIREQKELLEKQNEELKLLAYYDSLTQLLNRRSMEGLLISELERVHRYQSHSCIIILDLDYFKEVNDTYGHPIGDLLLIEVGKLLKEKLRSADQIARWGGEEYLIFLPHIDYQQGWKVAEKLRESIEKKEFKLSEYNVHITASFGVVELNHHSNHTLEIAYKEVDRSLYRAKEQGRNRIA